MEDWKEFLYESGDYLRAATGKNGKPSKLSNDIRYNLLALSFEKSVMAILMFNHDLADNHTFADLIDSVGRYITVPPALKDEVLDLEKTQSICNLFDYSREIPTEEVVSRLTKVAALMLEQALQVCNPAQSTAPIAC